MRWLSFLTVLRPDPPNPLGPALERADRLAKELEAEVDRTRRVFLEQQQKPKPRGV